MRPRIRTIKPEMRQDERYARLSHPARELFNGLITMADDEGRFRALTSAIAGHVFPYDVERVEGFTDQLKAWVGEIKDSGMVLFYIVENVPYGAFRHWARHQAINRPSPSDLPPPPSAKVVKENGLTLTEKGWKQTVRLHASSLNVHGELTESSMEAQSPRAGARSDPDPSLVVRLSEHLATRVRANDPKAKPDPRSERWLTEMRLLLKDRDGDTDEIRRIIDWCQSDPFWRSNVLSPAKLRSKFTQLLLKAGQGNGRSSVRQPDRERQLHELAQTDPEAAKAEILKHRRLQPVGREGEAA